MSSRVKPDMALGARIDISYHGGDSRPSFVLEDKDGNWHYRPLADSEVAGIVKILAGYLVWVFKDLAEDRGDG